MPTYRADWTMDGFTEFEAEDDEHAQRTIQNMPDQQKRDYGDHSPIEIYNIERVNDDMDQPLVKSSPKATTTVELPQ